MDEKTKLFAAALVIILGGNATSIYGVFNPEIYRPEPFTRFDGSQLERRVHDSQEELSRELAKELEAIRTRLTRCELLHHYEQQRVR